jgi:flagellum-specific ATP synthase
MMNILQACRDKLSRTELTRRTGRVRQLQGLAIDAAGPDAAIGELCRIRRRGTHRSDDAAGSLLAEVVGLKPGHVTLMPYGSLQGIAAGCEVQALGLESDLAVGPQLLGRVIDGFGQPMDGLPPIQSVHRRPLKSRPQNPMDRPPIKQILETGVRSIDALLTIGKGQRVGIFAGSGVGKSTLLAMVARKVSADVNVIALIGERGREVREFIENQLGPEGLKRSIVVVATSDQPALARLRAAHAAFTVAEYFREQGMDVLLTMDSVTRYAMARREVGLSAGEPPTARGYTPSVFAELPELCERCGTHASGGSITALLTVLVEGDDLNEPVADSLRAILDGHIVLSRQLAHQGQFPAIDPLRSTSRLMNDLAHAAERTLAAQTIKTLALLERNQQMVEIGAYEKGSNPELDLALNQRGPLRNWLSQSEGGISRKNSLEQLATILRTSPVGGTR